MRLRPRKVKSEPVADQISAARQYEFEPISELHEKRMRKGIANLLRAEKRRRSGEKRRTKRTHRHVCNKDEINDLKEEHRKIKTESKLVEQELKQLEQQFYNNIDEIRSKLETLPVVITK